MRKIVPVTAAEVAATKKKVEATERAHEKARADSAVAMAACELEVSLAQHTKENEARVARSDAAEVRAEEHASRLEDVCREQAAAWTDHLVSLQAERSTRDAAWTARRVLLDNRYLEVQ